MNWRGENQWSDKSTEQRFWEKVHPVGAEEGCWEWLAGVRTDGYGQFRYLGVNRGAHVVSFILEHGHEPEGMVLHRCDNRLCVNPAHLYDGDNKQNAADRSERNPDWLAKAREAGKKQAARLHEGYYKVAEALR